MTKQRQVGAWESIAASDKYLPAVLGNTLKSEREHELTLSDKRYR